MGGREGGPFKARRVWIMLKMGQEEEEEKKRGGGGGDRSLSIPPPPPPPFLSVFSPTDSVAR